MGLYTTKTRGHKTARLSIYTLWRANAVTSPMATLLFGILRRGSEAYPKLSLINSRLDDLFGTTLTMRNFLVGDIHILSLTAEMLEDAYVPASAEVDILDGVMDLLWGMLCRPQKDEDGKLRDGMVTQEKISLCDSIRADVNDPRSYALQKHRRIMCQNEPYGVSLTGDVDAVMAMTHGDINEMFDDFEHLADFRIYYTGQASHERVRDCLMRTLGDFRPSGHLRKENLPHVPPQTPICVEETLPQEQGRLCISWAKRIVKHEDTPAMMVFCELLGVMQSAILFRTVREELGLCYDCDTYFESTKGILTVTAGIHPDNRTATQDAICAAVVAIQSGHLDPEDVRLAQLSLQNAYEQIPESAAAIEAYWFRHHTEGLDIPPYEMLQRLQAVTPQDVIRVAGEMCLDTIYFLNAQGQDEEG